MPDKVFYLAFYIKTNTNMKKTIFILLYIFHCLSVSAQTEVTFTVNTANINVGENGMYLGGGIFESAIAHEMSDDDADGTYEVTVSLEEGTTGNYTFLNSPSNASDYGTSENLEGLDCADPENYNDRILPEISGDSMTIQHCFNTCESDGTCPPASEITFSVDMSNFTAGLGESDTVYLNGNFNGWCGECNPMSDNGDDIWSTTIPLTDGIYQYKFTVNGWDTQEQFSEVIEDCTVADGDFVNRTLSVASENIILPTVYWNLCAGDTPGDGFNVTFSVNTSTIPGGVGSNGMYLGGGIFESAMAHPMSDNNEDGVWEVTVNLSTDVIGGNYIFLNSPTDEFDWGKKENLEGQDCADPENYNDRIIPEFSGDTTLLHCFGECTGNDTGECPDLGNIYNVTFSVNTSNITVGENGMYVGGGVLGGATAYAMSDEDEDGTWVVTVPMEEGTSGNYTFLNSPEDSGDYSVKENISGLACADPSSYDDRILAEVTSDITLLHCYGSCETDGSCPEPGAALTIQGVIDFTVPEGQNNGKALHIYVVEDIEDMSIYSFNSYFNGNDSPTTSAAYTMPAESASAGDHILIARNIDAMNNYMDASSIFTTIYETGGFPSANGNDAIELLSVGVSVEVYGFIGTNPDTNGSGCETGDEDCWDTEDAWAYKVDGEWTYAEVDCTDGSTTTCDSDCPYPFADCTSVDSITELLMSGNWRSQAEAIGHMGVGPGDGFTPGYWEAEPLEKDYTGLYDDGFIFTETTMTHDTGNDGTIFGKKPAIDAAFDATGENAYPEDPDPISGELNNEYHNYPLGDYTDTYSLDLSGDYPAVVFETIGNIGFYTSPGAATFHILETGEGYAYFRNIGEDGLSWYNMMTTADYLSTTDNEILEMRIYPNPVDGNFVTILSPVQGLKEIEVFTVTGRKVMDTTINNSILNVSSFNSGFYMIKVTINGKSKISKLVVR
jgi:hypothetical protein